MKIQAKIGMIVLGLWLGTPGCDMESASTDNPAVMEKLAAMSSRAPSRSLDRRTDFYAPAPDDAALAQTRALLKARDLHDARKLTELITTPHAVWFSSGTPAEVTKAVHQTMAAADCGHRVPVLVAYNVPLSRLRAVFGGRGRRTPPRTRHGLTASPRASARAGRSSSSNRTASG